MYYVAGVGFAEPFGGFCILKRYEARKWIKASRLAHLNTEKVVLLKVRYRGES